ncbi:MAG: IS1-like element transposase [Symbiopectobacterium sp.]
MLDYSYNAGIRNTAWALHTSINTVMRTLKNPLRGM